MPPSLFALTAGLPCLAPASAPLPALAEDDRALIATVYPELIR